MTPDNLRAIGEALFGSRWQRELGRAIGANDRLVRFWVSGERSPPADLADRLDAYLVSELTKLMAAKRDLQRFRKKAA